LPRLRSASIQHILNIRLVLATPPESGQKFDKQKLW